MKSTRLSHSAGRAGLARLTIASAVLAALMAVAMSGWASAVTWPPLPAIARTVAQAAGVVTPHRVDLRAVAQATPMQGHAVARPFLTRDRVQVAAGQASPHGLPADRTLGLAGRAAGRQVGSSVAGFAGPFLGVSHDLQLQPGLDGDIAPPDTQFAAGPSHLMEMVDSTAAAFDRAGNPLFFVTLERFFDFATNALPSESGVNPRIFFDSSTGRWFASVLGIVRDPETNAPIQSDVLVAVSNDADPLHGFVVYDVLRRSGIFCDQPVFGISAGQVSVSCDAYIPPSFNSVFLVVLNKAQMEAGLPASSALFDNGNWFSIRPTLALNPNGPLPSATIATYNRRLLRVDNQIGVVALTGVPPATVSALELDLPMKGTAAPPAAEQIGDGPGSGSIVTLDDRFESSVWQGNQLWVTGNTACDDAGRAVSCVKLVEVDTSAWDPNAGSGRPSVAQDFSVMGGGGFHLYYPAVTLNSGGDPYVVFSESSSTTPVSLGAFTIPQCGSNFASGLVQPFSFLQGNGRYSFGSRWGDYSGAAVDPNDPNKLWLGGEYTAGPGVRQWGTAVAQAPVSTLVDGGRPYTGGHDAIGASAGATDWFFAEGFTGTNFEEFLTVQNPGPQQTMCVDYLLAGGAVISRSYNLTAASRTTVRVNDEIPPGQSVSMHVHAANPMVAERPMYFNFNGQWDGGHDVMGATSLGSTFYFAEGFTGANFDEFLTLMNVDSAATSNVNVTYFFDSGPPKTVAHAVAPHSRVTVLVNDPAEAGPNQNVSMLVQVASGPAILAERPMYFNFNGQWTGGHVVIGARGLSQHLDLAEGFVAANFEEFLTVLNPNATAANLTITYDLAGGGSPVVVPMTVSANNRATRLVNADLPAGTSASVHLDSDVGVVVERPMYFDFNQWTGGHDAVAVDSSTLGTTYTFAEGFVSSNFDEFLTVENGNATPVTITVTYFLAGGGTLALAPVTIPGHSRYTRLVNSDFKGTATQSMQVTSTGGSVLAERPMYFAF